MDSVVEIKFWGVRGSIPSPGPDTVKYGGNTVCLELRFKLKDRRRLIIIDAGSGIMFASPRASPLTTQSAVGGSSWLSMTVYCNDISEPYNCVLVS